MPGGALRDRLFAIDGRSLAAFRISIGTLVVADLLARAGALVQHYTDAGVLPRAALDRLFLLSDWHWSVHLWTGSTAGQAVLFAVAAAAAGALIVGYRTRLATVVTWVLLVSLQARNPMVSYGADQLVRLELFWAMFLPLGATWSLDRRRARRAGGTRADGDPGRQLSMASAALLLQPCVMYVFSGLLKQNPAWWSGDAIAYALSAETYATRFGRELLGHPALLESLSHAVPWIELLAPAALFVPWATPWLRTGALLLLVAFHLGIAAVLTTGLFQPVALAALLPFVPRAAWDRLSTTVGRGGAPVAAPRGARSRRAEAPPRPLRGRWYATALQGLVAALFVYALAWNVAGLRIEEYTVRQSLAWYREWWAAGRAGVPLTFRDYGVERMLGPVGWIGRVAGLHQRWDMFHRVGAEIRGWPLIVGTLGDGRRISVLEGGRPFAGAAHPRPDDALAFYPGTRWLVYFTYLRTPGTRPARELLPPVVARDWTWRHPERRLEALAILFARESPSAAGGTAPEPDVWYEGPVPGAVAGPR